jgi:hypothetical protein
MMQHNAPTADRLPISRRNALGLMAGAAVAAFGVGSLAPAALADGPAYPLPAGITPGPFAFEDVERAEHQQAAVAVAEHFLDLQRLGWAAHPADDRARRRLLSLGIDDLIAEQAMEHGAELGESIFRDGLRVWR